MNPLPYRPVESLVIAVDFDGACVKHEYPDVGADIGAAPVLLGLVEAGHRLVLWTMRSGKFLQDAVGWFAAGCPISALHISWSCCLGIQWRRSF